MMTAVGSRYGLHIARKGLTCERGSCIGQGFGKINFFARRSCQYG